MFHYRNRLICSSSLTATVATISASLISAADAKDAWKNLRAEGVSADKTQGARSSEPSRAQPLETDEAVYLVGQQDLEHNLGVLLDQSYGAAATARPRTNDKFTPGLDGFAGDKKWQPYVEFTVAPGGHRTHGQVNLFAPLAQDADSLLFADLRASVWTDDVQEGNFGAGYRQIVPGAFFGTDAIFGVYGFFDARRSAYDNMFYQGTIGAELITEHFEFRANGYLPSGKQYVVGTTGSGVALNGVNIYSTSTDLVERALPGFDVEAGIRIDFSEAAIRLNAGYFRFERGDTLVEGPRFRAEVEIDDPFGVEGAKLSFGGEVRNDKIRGTEAAGIVRLRMPIGGPSEATRAERRLSDLDRLMTRRIYRDEDIVSPVVRSPTPTLIAPVTDVVSGETLQAYFVANTAQGMADCSSVANACEFVTAQGFAGAGDTFLPVDAAGAISSVFTLNNHRQRVVGAGDAGTATVALTDAAKSVLIVTSLGGRPIVTGVNIGHFADTRIAGLSTNTATGITGNGFTGSATISNVRSFGGGLNFTNSAAAITVTDTILNSGANTGIELSNLTGTASFNNVDVMSAGGVGLRIDGGSGSATFDSDSSLDQSGAGATVEVVNGHTGTLTSGASISASNGTGLQFDNADGSYNFNGSSSLNGGDAGIDILSGSAGTFTFGSGTVITSPTGIAFNVDASAATVSFNGSITQNNAMSAVSVTANTGGSVTFGGSVAASTSTATGINLVGNTGAMVAFDGGLDIDTTSGTGFYATGGGTISVAASAGDESITSTAGQALNLNGVVIGTGGLNFDSISSTGSATTGIDINGVSGGALTVSGSVMVSGSTGNAIQLTGNTSAINFNGATAITMTSASTGVEVSGTTGGAVTFANLDIALQTANSLGVDFSGATINADVIATDFDLSSTSTTGTTGIDFSGTTGTGTIRLGDTDAGGASASVAGVNTGVRFTAASNATFIFGDGEAASDTGSSITATTAIAGGSTVTLGSYDFDDVNFTGTLDFATAAGVVFVAATATGDGSGSDVNNRANVTNADAITATGTTFVLINDGAAIDDTDGFTLHTGQTLASFGNGRTFVSSGLVIPANFSGIPGAGTTVGDPTGNGAATLTRTGGAGDTLTVSGTVDLQDFILSNAAAGNGLTASGATSITSTGLTVQNVAGQGIDLNSLTGTASTFNDTVISTTTGNAVDIVNSTVSFTGGLDIDTTSGTGFSAIGGGTISVAASAGDESITSTAGQALNLNGVLIGSGGVNFDSISSTGSATTGIDINGVSGGALTVSGSVMVSGSTGNAIQLTGNTSAINFNGATAITMTSASTGVEVSGTTGGAVSFANLDIALQTANSLGVDFSGATINADVTATDFDLTSTSTTGTTAVDLSGTTGTGTIRLGDTDAGGASASVAGVNTGVLFTAASNATFIFGDGEAASDTGSSITATTAIAGGSTVTLGSYDFDDVNFTGTLDFAAAGSDLVFVAATATGDFSGSDVNNRANVTSADAITATGTTFVLINDGAAIDDTDGFTLHTGQTLASFGNGRTFTSAGLAIPANFSGVSGATATVTDPTGNGAATLTNTGAGNTLTVSGTGTLQDFILSNAAAGNGLTASGATSITATGLTVQNLAGGGQGIDLNTLTGAASTFNNTVVSTTTGNAVDIVNSTVSFTGGLDITTTSGTGFSANGGGTISVAASGGNERITSTAGQALNLNGVAIGAGGLTLDSISSTGSAASGIDITGASGGSFTVSGATTITDSAGDSIALTNNSNTLSFGVTTIDQGGGATGVGIDIEGAGAQIGFGVTTIADVGAGSGQVGIDFNAATLGGAVSFESVAITGTGANDSIGIDLRGVTGGQMIDIGSQASPATGPSSSITGVNTGVFLDAASNTNFTFGDGEGVSDTGSTITATVGINATAAPVAGTYDFEDVAFAGSPGLGFGVGQVYFVDSDGATGGGDGSGIDGGNPMTLAAAELSVGVNDIIIIVNNGATVTALGSNGDDTLNLASGVQLLGFGDGAGGSQSVNMNLTVPGTISLFSSTVSIADPTGNGAATLTTGAANNVVTLGASGNRISGLDFDGTGGVARAIKDNGAGATNTTIDLGTIQNFATVGIEITPSTNTTISNIKFSDNASDVLVNAASTTISNVTSSNATNIAFTISNATGTTTLTNVSVSNAGGSAFGFTNSGGTISATTVGINGTGGAAIDISGGSGVFTFDATSSLTQASNAAAVSVSGGHSGSLTYSGTINATNGTGLQFDNADGSQYNFNGTVTLNGGDAGVDIVNGSSTSFTFATLNITNPTGVAFNIDSSAAGVTWSSGSLTQTNAATAFRANTSSGGIVNIAADITTGTGAAAAFDFTTAIGTFNFTGTNTITAGLGSGINISGGSSVVSFGGGSLTQASNAATVSVSGGHSGSLTYSGTINTTNGTGLQFDNADGSQYNFNGTVTLNGGDAGIDIVNGSSASFTFATLNITNPTGVAFNIDSSAAGVTWSSGSLTQTNAATAFRANNTSGGIVNIAADITTGTGAAAAFDFTTAIGTFNFTGTNTITAGLGSGINISGGSSVVSFGGGSLTQASNAATVSVSSGHSGSLTYSGTINATNGTGLQFDNADGSQYNFNGTVTLNGGDAGIDIVNGSSAAFTFANTSITSPTGVAFNIDSSTIAALTFGGAITQNSAASAFVSTGGTGGIHSISADISASTGAATAVNITSTGTYNFSGDLGLATTSGTGFSASGGGTISVTGANTSVNTTTGTALNLNGVTIAAGGISFDSIGTTGATTDAVNITGTSGGTVTLSSVAITAAGAANGIEINTATNNVVVSGGTASGRGVLISGGTGTVTIGANVSASAGYAFVVENRGSGSVTMNGTVGSSYGAVQVASNTGGTVTFGGVVTGTGTGISITGNTGGTIDFTALVNLDTGANDGITLNGNNGAAIDFANVDIDTTTGTGIDATGINSNVDVSGTVDVATSGSRAFEFTSTSGDYDYSGVTSTQSGISAQAFTNTHSGSYNLGTHSVTSPGVNALTIDSTTIDLTYASFTVTGTNPTGPAVLIDDVSGSLTVNGGTIRSDGRGIDLQNDGGVPNSFTLTTANTQFVVGNDAIFAETTTAGSTLNVNVSGVTAASDIGAQAVEIEWDNGVGTAVIDNNVFDSGSSTTGIIELDMGGTGIVSATISNTTIATNPSGEAIDVRTFDAAIMRLLISNNTITSSGSDAIRLEAEDTSSLNATVTNNVVAAVTNGSGIYLEVSAVGALACLDATGNSNGAAGPPASGVGGNSFELDNSVGGTLQISQANTTALAVANFGTVADVTSFGTITGNVACALP